MRDEFFIKNIKKQDTPNGKYHISTIYFKPPSTYKSLRPLSHDYYECMVFGHYISDLDSGRFDSEQEALEYHDEMYRKYSEVEKNETNKV